MTVIENEQMVFVDVDGTLIIHVDPDDTSHGLKLLDVLDPVTNSHVIVGINEPMVRLVKEEWHRGSHVFVWSRGGYAWAANVVKALGLAPCVHFVLSKPLVYFDDLESSEWLKHRVFLDPKTVYKKLKE